MHFKQSTQNKYNRSSSLVQNTPPLYDLTKIKTPISLYWGGEDYLADPDDVEELTPKLRNLVNNVYFDTYNHMDFVWGLRAANEIYLPIRDDILNDFDSQITCYTFLDTGWLKCNFTLHNRGLVTLYQTMCNMVFSIVTQYSSATLHTVVVGMLDIATD